jgi:hypothetical protein
VVRLDGCEGDRSLFALRAFGKRGRIPKRDAASVIGLCLTPRCCTGGFAKLVAGDVENGEAPTPLWQCRGLSPGTFMETSYLFLSERSPLRIGFAENEPEGGADRRLKRRRDEISASDDRSR